MCLCKKEIAIDSMKKVKAVWGAIEEKQEYL